MRPRLSLLSRRVKTLRERENAGTNGGFPVVNVEATAADGVHTFKVTGDVDLKTSPQLREKLQAALKSKPKGILIDMNACPYIDSSGIATLVEALQGLRISGGRMAIAGTAQRVKDIFEIAHLDGIFPMFGTVEEALKSLK